jgi:hypothetical protein
MPRESTKSERPLPKIWEARLSSLGQPVEYDAATHPRVHAFEDSSNYLRNRDSGVRPVTVSSFPVIQASALARLMEGTGFLERRPRLKKQQAKERCTSQEEAY